MKHFFSFVVLFCACSAVYAWDATGHRITAAVAYHYLTPHAKKQVDRILGKRGIIYYAAWADEIRSDTIYPSSYSWHFQDLDSGMTDSALVATLTDYPKEGGLLWRMTDSLTSALRADKMNPDWLRFVVHFTADRFCPMHTGRVEDKGGNLVKIKWFGAPANLHSLWDGLIIASYNYSFPEYTTFLIDTYGDRKKELEQRSRADELRHNYDMTQRIYDYTATWQGNCYNYIYDWKDEMNLQLYAAGVKLAQLLNEIYR